MNYKDMAQIKRVYSQLHRLQQKAYWDIAKIQAKLAKDHQKVIKQVGSMVDWNKSNKRTQRKELGIGV